MGTKVAKTIDDKLVRTKLLATFQFEIFAARESNDDYLSIESTPPLPSQANDLGSAQRPRGS